MKLFLSLIEKDLHSHLSGVTEQPGLACQDLTLPLPVLPFWTCFPCCALLYCFTTQLLLSSRPWDTPRAQVTPSFESHMAIFSHFEKAARVPMGLAGSVLPLLTPPLVFTRPAQISLLPRFRQEGHLILSLPSPVITI